MVKTHRYRLHNVRLAREERGLEPVGQRHAQGRFPRRQWPLLGIGDQGNAK